jgi:DNA polymerase
MPWTERQQSMLEAMGLQLWAAPAPASGAGAGAGAGNLRDARPADFPGSSPHGGAAVLEAPRADHRRADGVPPPRLAVAEPTPRTLARAEAAEAAEAGDAAETADSVGGAAARAADIAAMDWPALRRAVEQCRACSLCDSRTRTVFGVGHPRAHWMIVGEAPGEHEDLQGEPFVGAAGRLLDNMLRAVHLSRAPADPPEHAPNNAPNDPTAGPPTLPSDAARQVFIANALKCRPPRNRNPLPEEMKRCEPFLQRQIALVQPRIILAMGRFAVQSLLRSNEPIGQLRGRVHRYQGVPLVVTYHPAYLLRNPVDKSRAWEDLCLAAEVAEKAEAAEAAQGGAPDPV